MKDSPQLTKRRRYDAAFRAEALRLAGESRSTQAAARALNINVKLFYKWQKEALTPVAAARGAELDPATAAECLHMTQQAPLLVPHCPEQWLQALGPPCKGRPRRLLVNIHTILR